MNGAESAVVTDASGATFKAWLKTAEGHEHDPQVVLQLTDGTQFLVPRDLLVSTGEGHFKLSVNLRDYARNSRAEASKDTAEDVAEDTVVSVAEETLQVGKRSVTKGVVRLSKRVVERQETVDLPLQQARVKLERVSVNQVVSEAAPVRYKGDTMIVPLYEEVLVVSKQLMLAEEVRITKARTEQRQPQQVTLRRETVELSREAAKARDERS